MLAVPIRLFVRSCCSPSPPPYLAKYVEQMSSKGRELALGYSTSEVHNNMLEIYRSSRDEQRTDFRNRKAQSEDERSWPFWEAFGLVVRFIFVLHCCVSELCVFRHVTLHDIAG